MLDLKNAFAPSCSRERPMPSRRRFIFTSATAALAASVLQNGAPGGNRMETRRDSPEKAGLGPSSPSTRPGGGSEAGGEDPSRALRRARSRASAGQSVPFPAP